ncbi:hypothetical protein [Microlunatus speluncae]|uniref:hypothetical protein n=1 Tax=Microlunatus speluncae TaxID=2594267 RepID=UPI001266091E|nr:hypothetical protein [Microlunatus speluncae]
MAPWRRRLVTLLVGLALGALTLPACTRAEQAPPEPSVEWARLEQLPVTFRAETLDTGSGRLIIAGRSSDPDRPTLLISDSEAVREVRLVPESSYGRTAALSSIAVTADRAYAIGGDRGGAHGNVRWSVWSGNLDGLTEHEQIFWTFGGQSAGSLTTIVAGPDGPMIIGNWGSPHGLDITVWTERQDVWTRHDSRGSALASTARELLSEKATAVIDNRVIIAGTALGLTNGLVPRAATWSRDGGTGDWRRTDLPTDGTASSALDVACAEECLIAGVVDGRVAAWSGDGTTWRAMPPTGLAADEKAVTIRAFRVDAGWQIAVARQPEITIIDVATGRTHPGPGGTLIDAVGVGPTAHLLVEDDTGTRATWRADLHS